ncbi:hypothetical protein STENM327S_07583 [Streptomyces tendae]
MTSPSATSSRKPATSSWVSVSTIRTLPPTMSGAANCHSEMSKHWDAVWVTTWRVPAASPTSSIFMWRWLSIPACSHSAPLGAPVKPEVK